MKPSCARVFVLAALLLSVMACNQPAENPDASKPSSSAERLPNTLSEAEITAGWRLLFDGQTTNGWRGTYQDDVSPERWVVEDGMLRIVGEAKGFASIITEEQFGRFELSLEFKIEEGANSGIKYFVLEREPPTPGRGLGPEYQIWDDQQAREPNRKMAALYDLIVPEDKEIRPLGTFNEARLVVRGDSVEHWLNGRPVVRYVRGSEDFRKRIEKSKYRDIEGFGMARQGHILLQDEGGHRVWFRTIKIREL